MEDNKVAVLLEDLLSKFRTFGEGLDGLREEMNNRFNHFEQKFNHLYLLQNRNGQSCKKNSPVLQL